MPRYRVNGHTVTVPYSETDYRQILARSGSGLTLQGVVPDPSATTFPFMAGEPPNFMQGQILGPLIRGGAGVLGNVLGRLAGGPAAGEEEQAPLAGLITGDCPPGRVLRRVAWGRDVCARRARMNYTNVHALRRAMRRVTGFAKIAKATINFTQKVKMKKRGKRS